MALKITQIIPRATDRYPWTHRVEISDDYVKDVFYWELYSADIPGIWVGNNAFYTNSNGATFMSLKCL